MHCSRALAAERCYVVRMPRSQSWRQLFTGALQSLRLQGQFQLRNLLECYAGSASRLLATLHFPDLVPLPDLAFIASDKLL